MENINSILIFKLFLEMNFIIKIIIISFLIGSIWSWKIIGDKFFQIRKIYLTTKLFEKSFWSGKKIDDLYSNMEYMVNNPMAAVFVAAMREWKRTQDINLNKKNSFNITFLQMRIKKIMNVTIKREISDLKYSLIFLLIIGKISLFIGLFGVIYSIINSFIAVSFVKEISFKIISFDIIEALFIIIINLILIIPAIIFYSIFYIQIKQIKQNLKNFADEFLIIFSRQLEVD